ncbi:RagB/SusD family nutrient uptake outer membrane protein [Marivirga sp. S37H4]|uniref:RagB/SusD family nutrient uptake outer membrane protein n=1 Tax=Marivirga aurantiaca TaxID=2802615 RepID=A0A935CB01_9BACT|nr:RagB/SusD family nutrient uptake outer membrane protein [Marivirga aurantiaca]MBK6266890.1 RagB/SusD family nutrient uptake outer membrane protein [Marivirga aurantiaca]
MKKNKNIYFLTLICFWITSCEMLDVDPPYDTILSENAITDKRGLDAAVNGVYDGLQSGAIVLDYVVIADIAADNLRAAGSKIDYINIDNNDSFSNNIYVEAVWNAHFDVINRVNNVLVNLSSVSGLSDAEINRTEAEMRTVRALCYFNLVRMYGGVPLRDEPVAGASNEELFIGRASKSETYTFISDDLETAAQLMEGSGKGSGLKVDEPTILALLARVKLYQEDWPAAEAYAKSVINEFGLELDPDYEAIFDENSPSEEIIFQIDFVNDNDINPIAKWLLAAGRYEAAATEEIFELYQTGDNRFTVSVGESNGDYYANKYNNLQNENDSWIVVRLAEMYMVAAEAINEQSYDANSEAFDFLNAIRDRAGLADVGPLDATNQEILRRAIALERRKELAFEGHRWHDLVRTDRAMEVLEITNPNKLLFPIPQSELNTNNHPDMVQNADY